MSQSNPGKYLQILSGSPQTIPADTIADVQKETDLIKRGGKLGQ